MKTFLKTLTIRFIFRSVLSPDFSFGKYKHLAISTPVMVLLVIAAYGIAQIPGPPQSPAASFPAGALVYAEARNLKDLLIWWRDSSIRENWVKTANYSEFQSSRLYLKLQERITKFGSGGKFTFSLDNLITASGERSALALYNIGELKAVAATEISFAEAAASKLWLSHERFVKKQLGKKTYYVEPEKATLVFAYDSPYLIVATDEELLRQTLANTAEPQQVLALSDKWKLAQPPSPKDEAISLYLDMEALQNNRYFKRYWIHRNVKDFALIRSAWIQLQISNGELVERRYFAKGAERIQTQSADDYLNAFLKLHFETLYLHSGPGVDQTAREVFSFINPFTKDYQKTSYPPAFTGAVERAAQAETKHLYAQMIDEPLPETKKEEWLQADQESKLAELLERANPAATIRLSYPVWDDQALFVTFPKSLAVHLNSYDALDRARVLDLLLQQKAVLYTTRELGVRWKQLNETDYHLESFSPVYASFRKPFVVIASRESDFRNMIGALPLSGTPPESSFALIRWTEGRWKYSRLMNRLDTGVFGGDGFLFFSQNLDSLLRTLDTIDEIAIQKTPSEETVRYSLRSE